MRGVNGLPLVLAALMLGAGTLPAPAQEMGDVAEVTLAGIDAGAGGGSAEADGNSAEGGQDPGEVSPPDDIPTAEGATETRDSPEDFWRVDDGIMIEAGGPQVLDGAGDIVLDDATGEPEGDLGFTALDSAFPVDVTAEPMLTATDTDTVLVPGAVEVQRGATGQDGASDAGSNGTCSTLQQAKRPMICD